MSSRNLNAALGSEKFREVERIKMRSNRANSFFFQNYPDIWISGDAYLTEVVIYRAVEEVPRGRVAPPMDLKLVGQSFSNPLRHLKRFRNVTRPNVAGSSTRGQPVRRTTTCRRPGTGLLWGYVTQPAHPGRLAEPALNQCPGEVLAGVVVPNTSLRARVMQVEVPSMPDLSFEVTSCHQPLVNLLATSAARGGRISSFARS